jgi:hypothetical protein
MEQKLSISSTLEKFSLVHNIPVEFSINGGRIIRFKFPSIMEMTTEINLRMFIGLMSMTEEKLKELGIKLLVKPDSYGALAYGLLFNENYSSIISHYLLKYIDKSELKNKEIYVANERVTAAEINYIIDTIMISIGKKEYVVENKEEEKELEDNPIMAKILAAQKESEEKLNKIKQKKAKNSGKGYTIEEIMLAVSYEFGLSMDYLLNLNYFALVWYFSFVAKVDAHKLNQMILSSGMSKQKTYNYWLNK